ncbi:MAG TPA: toll/interleukin-1 receptor domain-containing protein [Roseiflexaceae bacterium]|nr:toll/interleukin-1 receptor domain-containing protein [Roseiflexaceae bacterium]
MANDEHLAILRQGVGAWNRWRVTHGSIKPDLEDAQLFRSHLRGIDFSQCNLQGVNLEEANLRRADLVGANLTKVNLQRCDLRGANLSRANLESANLRYSILNRAIFAGSVLCDCNMHSATVEDTIFTNVDLRAVLHLDYIIHDGPSTIGIDTLYRSSGRISENFLRGCGVPDSLIEYQRSLVNARDVIHYYSCVISYSSKDESFIRRLHSRMRDEQMRVWYAAEDLKAGEPLIDQIDQAIRLFDKVIVVLSETSLSSAWVQEEIRRTWRAQQGQSRKLFPIRLVDYDVLRTWACFDHDTATDLAAAIRALYIPDFTRWKDHDTFEISFTRLLRDLYASEKY